MKRLVVKKPKKALKNKSAVKPTGLTQLLLEIKPVRYSGYALSYPRGF